MDTRAQDLEQLDAWPDTRPSQTEAGQRLVAAWRQWGLLQAVLRCGYIEDTRKQATLKRAS